MNKPSSKERAIKAYQRVARIPSIQRASTHPSGNNPAVLHLNSEWNQRNVAKGEYTKFRRSFVLDADTLKVIAALPPSDTSTEKYTAISSSSNKRAVLRKGTGKDGEEFDFMEIWNKTSLMKVYDYRNINDHGKIYTDDHFGTMYWSHDETKLLYVAEMKRTKGEPLIKCDYKSVNDVNPSFYRGEEYNYQDEWGEQMVGKHMSIIVVLHVETDAFQLLDVQDEFAPGQCIWNPDDTGVVSIGYKVFPRRLGLYACTNRPCKLLYTTLNNEYTCITDNDAAICSPRLSPDRKTIVWLERSPGGTHNGCHRLVRFDWETKSTTVIVDIVHREANIHDGEKFYGIYTPFLPDRCWTRDSQQILFSSQQYNDMIMFAVNIETGVIKKIPHNGNVTILDVYDDIVTVSLSSPTTPPYLLVGRVPSSDNDQFVLQPVDPHPHVSEMEEITWQTSILQNPEAHPLPRYSDLKYSTLYVGPISSEVLVPLIVCPHGGPHSSSTTQFSFITAFFTQLGFATLFVNYRGSLGAGEDSVLSLPGHVGDADVKDVQYAVEQALLQHKFLNEKCVFLFGGSHGGFLSCHLAAQFPGFYKAVAVRNPVTDISSMACVSDIPDWSWCESGQPYSSTSTTNSDTLKKMWLASPMRFIDNMKTAMFLMIGKQDLRVPPSQGYQYYHALKARGIPVRMTVYEDCHSLAKVPVEVDCLINSAVWLLEHTRSN